MSRKYNLVDRLIIGLETGMKTCLSPRSIHSQRPNPANDVGEIELNEIDRKHSAGLMRVNHTGEVCAQALYQSQALFARDAKIKEALEQAALEENDHLAWCASRLEELGEKTSYLNPVWYGASYGLGAIFGLIGDKTNLGFLKETENQVGAHLLSHLEQLPPHDFKSKAIVEQMKIDESEHENLAYRLGANELPSPVKFGMQLLSKLMTKTTYHI